MPAAAVIPAPVAYANVVAVKKLVVGFLAGRSWSSAPLRAVSTGGDARHPFGVSGAVGFRLDPRRRPDPLL